jgi:hemerythrin-like domain-containing protein
MATKTESSAQSAITMLKEDHRKVRALFREYSELGERAHKSKQRLAERIFEELEVHSALEERIFYPAVRERSCGVDEVVAEGLEEHHVVDVLMAEIRALSPEDERFDAKMKVLCENVDHHIEEEETEMLPDARKCLGSELEALGEQMAELRRQLTRPETRMAA